MTFKKTILPALFVFTVSLLLSACSGGSKPVAVENPAAHVAQATPEPSPVRTEPAKAPQLSEVEEAVKRVFHDTAVVHPNYKSTFLQGDFNGDLSQDLAVVIQPVAEKLADMNEDPRWLVREPRGDRNHPAKLQIAKDEALLAVIHGYGTKDWRDPEATQTFLLKNVVGSDFRVQNGKEFVTQNVGRKLPRTQGDLIGETVQGVSGYLYYNAATYNWYDPKTFAGDAPAGAFHGRNAMRR
jgi:hypothetical protein